MLTHFDSSQTPILLFGEDAPLVETRRWVLERAGFQVASVLRLPELTHTAAQQQIALFILCDSLSPEIRSKAVRTIHTRLPGAKMLVLVPNSFAEEFDPPVSVFTACEGPGKLVATIHKLLGQETPFDSSAKLTAARGFQ